MPILITAVLLLGTATALAILPEFRPRFRFSWLLAVGATTAAWLSVMLWLPQLPFHLVVPLWQSVRSSNSFASFLTSNVSWPYALSLITVVLCVFLTAPTRSDFPNPSSWALCLAVAAIGMLAAFAEGPLTLALLWATLDLMEAGFVFSRAEPQSPSRQVPFAFAMRLGSTALMLLALALSRSTAETAMGFGKIQQPGTTLLSGAALLRLAALAIPWPTRNVPVLPDAVGTIVHLVAGISAVAFLAQVSIEPRQSAPALLVVCAGAALYAGWMWFRAPDIVSGRPLWLMGAGTLAVAAALRGNPIGVAAWGNSMILAGAPLFFTTLRERWMNRVLLLGLWITSAMPFALTSTAWVGGGRILDLTLPAFLLAQSMLLAGYLHLALLPGSDPRAHVGMASLRGIYRVGTFLPLAIGVLIGIWGWVGASRVGTPFAGFAVVPMTAALAWGKRRLAFLNPTSPNWIPPAWSRAASATVREVTRVQGGVRRLVDTITRTIEGEAGIMWSLLLLVLLVSFIVSRDR